MRRRPHSAPPVLMGACASLRYRRCYAFLCKHCKPVAAEIKDEYIDTLSKVHFSYFKAYVSRLQKLQYEDEPDKEDVLGADDNATKRTGFFSSKTTLKNRATLFTGESLGGHALVGWLCRWGRSRPHGHGQVVEAPL